MEVAATPGSPAFVDAQEEQDTWGAHEALGVEDGTGAQENGTKEASSKQKHSEVFIAGLDREARAEDVCRRFAEVGEIAWVRLRVDSEGLNKGYAFVRYKSALFAKRAAEELATGVEICGKNVWVVLAEDSDTLFLGNINRDWSKEQVLEKLSEYKVEGLANLLLMDDKEAGKANRGFGFLEMTSQSAALKALRLLSKPDAKFGAHLPAKVTWAAPLIQPAEEQLARVKSVFIDGLPESWTQETVRDHFASYGEILSVVLSKNMPNAKRKGYGFINFAAREAAEKVIAELNGKQIGTGDTAFTVLIKLANPPVQDRGTGGRGGRGGGRFGRGGRGGPPAVSLDSELVRILRDQVKEVERFFPEEIKVFKVEEVKKVSAENGSALDGGKRKAVSERGGAEKRAKVGGEAGILKSIPAEVAPMGEWLLKAGAIEERDEMARNETVNRVAGKSEGAGNQGRVAEAAVRGEVSPGNAKKVEGRADASKTVSASGSATVKGEAVDANGEEAKVQSSVLTGEKLEAGKVAQGVSGAQQTKAPEKPSISPTPGKATPVKDQFRPVNGQTPPLDSVIASAKTTTPPVSSRNYSSSKQTSSPVPTVGETGPAQEDPAEAAREGPVNEKAAPDTTWDCLLCGVANASEAELLTHKATRVHHIVERLKNGPKPLVKTPLSLLHEYAVKRRAELIFETKADDLQGPFEVTVTLRGGPETRVQQMEGVGIGRDKKRAKQAAAVTALLKILERSPEVEAELLRPKVEKAPFNPKSPSSSAAGGQSNPAQARRPDPPFAVAIQGAIAGKAASNGRAFGAFSHGGRGGSVSQRGGRISPGRGGGSGFGGRGGVEADSVNSIPLGGGKRGVGALGGLKRERGFEGAVSVTRQVPRPRTEGFAPLPDRGPAFASPFRQGSPSRNIGRATSPGDSGSFRGPRDNSDAVRAAALVAAYGFDDPSPVNTLRNASLSRSVFEGASASGFGGSLPKSTSLVSHVESHMAGRKLQGSAKHLNLIGGQKKMPTQTGNPYGRVESRTGGMPEVENPYSKVQTKWLTDANPVTDRQSAYMGASAGASAGMMSWQQGGEQSVRKEEKGSRAGTSLPGLYGSPYAAVPVPAYDPSHPSLYTSANPSASQNPSNATGMHFDGNQQYGGNASASKTPQYGTNLQSQSQQFGAATQKPLPFRSTQTPPLKQQHAPWNSLQEQTAATKVQTNPAQQYHAPNSQMSSLDKSFTAKVEPTSSNQGYAPASNPFSPEQTHQVKAEPNPWEQYGAAAASQNHPPTQQHTGQSTMPPLENYYSSAAQFSSSDHTQAQTTGSQNYYGSAPQTNPQTQNPTNTALTPPLNQYYSSDSQNHPLQQRHIAPTQPLSQSQYYASQPPAQHYTPPNQTRPATYTAAGAAYASETLAAQGYEGFAQQIRSLAQQGLTEIANYAGQAGATNSVFDAAPTEQYQGRY
ncbi:hypothetical protein KFL_003150080 [Klebsormidium nitens]|uniref:RNA-binding protein n=1 Tax=Klebsormidium nitens TaxID=105231 RepID=A0A1Y1I8I3_KLENI|nr:hypothetical protein KFL_003150080 [Klebsormidium nitens]|eukprot:GAQ86843.1 hypothetical protein KFL_003150080 [Klebsormidium nitens]